jgi:hypothetical protein
MKAAILKQAVITSILSFGLANIMLAPPAARLTDFHQMPLSTPVVIPIPHVGGPISGPGAPTVLIGRLPAAKIGQMLITIQPPKMSNLGPLQARSAADILTNSQLTSNIQKQFIAHRSPLVPSGGLLLHPHPLIRPGAIPTSAIINLGDGGPHGQLINIHQTPLGPVAMPGLLQHP